MSDIEMQRQVTQIALAAAGRDSEFALAGSGAVREHGLIERPTQDVDLFTARQDNRMFDDALRRVEGALLEHGFQVERQRVFEGYARLGVSASDGRATEIDLGVDWRAQPAVQLDVGPVLSQDDAVGNKVAALFSRGEARDYLDVDAIRESGRYTDTQLLELARKADGGFDLDWFAQALAGVRRVHYEEVAAYGVSQRGFEGVQHRLGQWGAQIEAREQRAVLDSLNPTGSVFATHDPAVRMEAELGPDMTTFAATHGLSDDAQIEIFRGIPQEALGGIVPGDFVTTERQLAADYAGNGRVVSLTVNAGDVLDAVSEPDGGEYIYRPGAARELARRDEARAERATPAPKVTADKLAAQLGVAARARAATPSASARDRGRGVSR